MIRLTAAYQPPSSRQRFAAIWGATEKWENTGEPGYAIIANTLAWADGYTQVAPNPLDIFPHTPTLNPNDDMHPAEDSEQPDRQSSMKVADFGVEEKGQTAQSERNRAELQEINKLITNLVERLFAGRPGTAAAEQKPDLSSGPPALEGETYRDNRPGLLDPNAERALREKERRQREATKEVLVNLVDTLYPDT